MFGPQLRGTVWEELGVVALVEEVCHWGWDLRFQKPMLSWFSLSLFLPLSLPLSSILSFTPHLSHACRSGCKALGYYPSTTPFFFLPWLSWTSPLKLLASPQLSAALVTVSLHSNRTATKKMIKRNLSTEFYLSPTPFSLTAYTENSQTQKAACIWIIGWLISLTKTELERWWFLQ